MKRYTPKGRPIVAVQLNVETPGLLYEKWGGQQHAKQGDWLVDNAGEFYSIDAESFKKTYRPVEDVDGHYVKTKIVWAEEATADGHIKTKEGMTAYKSGDMLVYNEENRSDGYAMPAADFYDR